MLLVAHRSTDYNAPATSLSLSFSLSLPLSLTSYYLTLTLSFRLSFQTAVPDYGSRLPTRFRNYDMDGRTYVWTILT